MANVELLNNMKHLVLANDDLEARFDCVTGQLIHLAPPGHSSFLEKTRCRYRLAGQWHEQPSQFKIVDSSCDAQHVQFNLLSPHASVIMRYELDSHDPLLRVSVTVKGVKRRTTFDHPAFPAILFTDDFVDAFDDDFDLYNDGVELGAGMELPCWRVFPREGHQDGVMVVTRSKLDMSRMQILERGILVRPHTMVAYDSGNLSRPMVVTPRLSRQVKFEIGPWTAPRHSYLVKHSGLNDAVSVGPPKAAGQPPRRLKGLVFDAVDIAQSNVMSNTYQPGKWMIAKMPWARGGKALFASTGVQVPSIEFDPKLQGVYRIFVGIANGEGVVLSLTGDHHARIRRRPGDDRGNMRSVKREAGSRDAYESTPFGESPFRLYLSGRHRSAEIDFGIEQMDGRRITLQRVADLHEACAIDYIRFEPLTAGQAQRWERENRSRSCISLSGFADIVDICRSLDATQPSPRAFASNVAEHARCGFDKIYWRIDGQCSDFQTTQGTQRYVSARVHGIFKPQAKAYGRVLARHDLLRIAVDAGREHNIEIWGWQRFNNYHGNVQSDFYRQHPQYHEQLESGRPAGKLCLAIPQVRQHKIAILVEAARYGLHGLSLGFLRHPPVLDYHPILVNGYEKTYGSPPPREMEHGDPHHLRSLPPTSENDMRWQRYRASFLTQFGRELRIALHEAGLGHVKISIWVRPNHCLFDGIDLERWLQEGLCDEVVAGAIVKKYDLEYPDIYAADQAWKDMVQRYVPLYRTLWVGDYPHAIRSAESIIKAGYDGLCTYESNDAVLMSDMIRLYWSLRSSGRARA